MKFLFLIFILISMSLSKEVQWEDLVPKGYSVDEISAKYEKKLDDLKIDLFSQEAEPILDKINNEYENEINNAPSNDKLNNMSIKLGGFIVPLSQDKELINEFLLVPTLGACIHVPPPPLNQTIYVKVEKGQEVKVDDMYAPIYVLGVLKIKKQTTTMAETGYSIFDAKTAPYILK